MKGGPRPGAGRPPGAVPRLSIEATCALLDALGEPTDRAIAARFGIAPARVSEWRRYGVTVPTARRLGLIAAE